MLLLAEGSRTRAVSQRIASSRLLTGRFVQRIMLEAKRRGKVHILSGALPVRSTLHVGRGIRVIAKPFNDSAGSRPKALILLQRGTGRRMLFVGSADADNFGEVYNVKVCSGSVGCCKGGVQLSGAQANLFDGSLPRVAALIAGHSPVDHLRERLPGSGNRGRAAAFCVGPLR